MFGIWTFILQLKTFSFVANTVKSTGGAPNLSFGILHCQGRRAPHSYSAVDCISLYTTTNPYIADALIQNFDQKGSLGSLNGVDGLKVQQKVGPKTHLSRKTLNL